MKTLEKTITVKINEGVHNRVATRFAQIAQQYKVQLFIVGEELLDCSSVLDVLTMGFAFGTRIKFRAQGEEADLAIAAVEELLVKKEEP